MLMSWEYISGQFLPEFLELTDYSVSETLCKFYYVPGEEKSNFGKQNNLRLPPIHLPGCLRDTRTVKMTPYVYKLTLKMLNRASKSQMEITSPSIKLISLHSSGPDSSVFSPFSHSPFPFSSSNFYILLTQLLSPWVPKPQTTPFSLTESHSRHMIFCCLSY